MLALCMRWLGFVDVRANLTIRIKDTDTASAILVGNKADLESQREVRSMSCSNLFIPLVRSQGRKGRLAHEN